MLVTETSPCSCPEPPKLGIVVGTDPGYEGTPQQDSESKDLHRCAERLRDPSLRVVAPALSCPQVARSESSIADSPRQKPTHASTRATSGCSSIPTTRTGDPGYRRLPMVEDVLNGAQPLAIGHHDRTRSTQRMKTAVPLSQCLVGADGATRWCGEEAVYVGSLLAVAQCEGPYDHHVLSCEPRNVLGPGPHYAVESLSAGTPHAVVE
jgi:hypothetical protein